MIAGRDYLVPVDLDPERDREAWLADRLRGHGGSDVAKILNEHPTRGPIDVWRAHTGDGIEDDDTERSETGRYLEPVVLGWFAEGGRRWPRTGGAYHVIKPPTVYHRDRPWQRGSADGLGYYPEVVAHLGLGADLLRATSVPSFLVEVKTHGWFGARGYSLDDDDGDPIISVPPDKRIQCAWYMELYDVDAAYLAALVDTHLRRTFLLPRDRQLGAMMLEEVEQFRKRYILTGEPPPPDGKPSYRDYLRKRFKSHDAEIVDSSDAVDVAAEALIAIKRDQARLKKERELAEQVLKKHIGEHAGVKTASGLVTWKSQRSGKYRDKELRAELYLALGWTDLEIAAHEAKFALDDVRVLRTPGKD